MSTNAYQGPGSTPPGKRLEAVQARVGKKLGSEPVKPRVRDRERPRDVQHGLIIDQLPMSQVPTRILTSLRQPTPGQSERDEALFGL
jgi:hypothetical protein